MLCGVTINACGEKKFISGYLFPGCILEAADFFFFVLFLVGENGFFLSRRGKGEVCLGFFPYLFAFSNAAEIVFSMIKASSLCFVALVFWCVRCVRSFFVEAVLRHVLFQQFLVLCLLAL